MFTHSCGLDLFLEFISLFRLKFWTVWGYTCNRCALSAEPSLWIISFDMMWYDCKCGYDKYTKTLCSFSFCSVTEIRKFSPAWESSWLWSTSWIEGTQMSLCLCRHGGGSSPGRTCRSQVRQKEEGTRFTSCSCFWKPHSVLLGLKNLHWHPFIWLKLLYKAT